MPHGSRGKYLKKQSVIKFLIEKSRRILNSFREEYTIINNNIIILCYSSSIRESRVYVISDLPSFY